MDQQILVAAVDDHPAILGGVAEILPRHLPNARVIVLVKTVTELLERDVAADVVLLDIALADDSDIEDNVARLRERSYPVLLYTQERRLGPISRAFRAGASGLVGKHEDLSVLAEAIRTVVRGESHLTAEWAAVVEAEALPRLAPREAEAVTLYATGLPLKSVARRMNISPETVREYLDRARRKYAEVGRPIGTKVDYLRRAVEDGYLEFPPP